MGFYVQRDIKNEEIKFETDLYYFSFALRVCMTSGNPAIESKGHPYSFTTSPMKGGSEHRILS